MVTNTVLICIVISVLTIVESDINCDKTQREYTRIKRAKYYSNPPQKFYRRPPMSYPVKGAFSYTPPPAYMMEEEPQNQPSYRPEYRPTKVSNSIRTEGLGDEDISNLVKYLSKNDLDKIIEYAGDKSGRYSSDNNFESEYNRPRKTYGPKDISYDSSPNFSNGNSANYDPSLNFVEDLRQSKILNSNHNGNQYQETASQIQGPFNDNNSQYNPTANNNRNQLSFQNLNPQEDFTQLDGRESMRYYQIYQANTGNVVNREQAMNPINTWQEEYAGSYTNNVPTVVEPEKGYKVESFGDLPLMNSHDSKLHTVSSYSVPRYTVTQPPKTAPPRSLSSSSSSSSSSSYSSSLSNIRVPPVEPAPSIEAAKEQSDAHLKAIKIWTHKSKGAEYYLHSDGRLTLETHGKPIYGQ